MKSYQFTAGWKICLALALCAGAVNVPAWAAPTAAPATPAPALALPAGVARPPAPPTFPNTLTLTPAQAADLAEQEALEIQEAREDIAQAQAAVSQAQVGQHVQAGITATEGREGPSSSITFNGQSFEIMSSIIRQESVSVTQPLYTGGRVESQIAAARAGVGAAVAETDTTIRAIRLAAEEAAYAVLRTTELAGVAQREVDSNREHLRLAQAMLAAGTVAQFEVVQAQTQVSAAEGNLVAAQTAVDQARAQLRKLLVLPQTQPLEVVAPLAPVLQPAGGLADLITAGWNGRPEIRALQAQIETADANLRLAQETDNLSASLDGEYQHNASATGFTTQQHFWEAVVTLTKPILDGSLRKSLVDEANSRLRDARLALEAQRQQIALNVTQAYLAASQALQQLQVATQGVVEAREAARIAEVRFQAGVGTGIEVLDAQIAQASAEASQVNASHDLQLALIQLRDAMGQPLEGALKP